jgi:N-acetylglucosaminyl-diphospho-decaprenol L-rhamnosyltransferase
MPDEVTVIVPVWNGRALVERLMGSLRAQTYAAAEILIVDNASEDGAPEAAEALGARVVRMGSNTGFARAVNRGIQECKTGWLAIVNSDVELAADWIERMLEAAQEPGVWFAAGKILDALDRGRIDGTYDAVCRGGCAWRVGQGRADGPAFSSGCEIRFASGTASLFRTEIFSRAGLLDETFESYLEDVEFSLRCAGLDYTGCYVPEALAYHVGSAALGKWHPETVRMISRNQVFLVAKYYPASLLCRLAWPILLSQTLWGLVALRHGCFTAFLRGKLAGVMGFSRARQSPGRVRMEPKRLLQVLTESERKIRDMQRRTGFDWYWRLYFALTTGEAN